MLCCAPQNIINTFVCVCRHVVNQDDDELERRLNGPEAIAAAAAASAAASSSSSRRRRTTSSKPRANKGIPNDPRPSTTSPEKIALHALSVATPEDGILGDLMKNATSLAERKQAAPVDAAAFDESGACGGTDTSDMFAVGNSRDMYKWGGRTGDAGGNQRGAQAGELDGFDEQEEVRFDQR